MGMCCMINEKQKSNDISHIRKGTWESSLHKVQPLDLSYDLYLYIYIYIYNRVMENKEYQNLAKGRASSLFNKFTDEDAEAEFEVVIYIYIYI